MNWNECSRDLLPSPWTSPTCSQRVRSVPNMPKPATTGLAIEDRKVPADPEVTLRIECSDGARGVEHVAVLRRAPLVK